MSTLGPRMQKIRQKELGKLGPIEDSYDKFKEGTASDKVRIINLRPDIALGAAAGKEMEEVQFRIYFILLASLILAILTTVSYTTIDEENKLKEYLVAAFSISWFLFISFIFLLFNATRLLHIILFGIVLALCSTVYEKLDREEPSINRETQNIVMAGTVFAGIAASILLYYYFTSRKEEELIELKTGETIRRRNAEITKLIKTAYKEGKEEGEKERSQKGMVYESIGQKAIEKYLASPAPKKTDERKSKKSKKSS